MGGGEWGGTGSAFSILFVKTQPAVVTWTTKPPNKEAAFQHLTSAKNFKILVQEAKVRGQF